MADATTQTEPVQPTQQNLTAIEKARLSDTRKTETLNAVQAYDELELFGTEPGEYRDDSPVQGEYWRFKFRGAIVVVSPEFKKAYDEGTMVGLTATPTVFEVKRADPNNAGQNMMAVGYGWSLSYSDVSKKEKAMKAMKSAADVEFNIKKNEALANKKLEAFMKADLSQFISEEEMLAMMKEA